MYPLHLLNPFTNIRYISRHFLTVHFSQLTLHALIITCSGVHCGLKYQHWPMKQTLVVDQKGTVPT